MSILDEIQEAQTKAAEDVICANLEKLSLAGDRTNKMVMTG